uniref:solute carrier family 43 member 3-like n=1 Tax=Ciona intestinalis TaxID=7719 RepID=UPI000180AF41|nr:solute carrier family 43 member 3-like [Ciona intestinalis]|eukprot:XP_002124037.1 solute carrier family 43 member 3-like [Ciona intestinalis]
MREIKHLASLITAVLETLCFSGMVYGWGSMSYMLEKEGYFNSTCNNSVGSLNPATPNADAVEYAAPASNLFLEGQTEAECEKQEKMLTLVFTLSSVISSALIIITGYIFDKFGTWVVRFCGISLYIVGWLIMAVTTRMESWAVFLAMILVGISGFPLVISNVSISNLFQNHRVLVISVINGAFDSSAVTFALMKIAYDSGIEFSYIMYFMTACAVLMIARFLFLMPRMHIPSIVRDDFEYGLQCCKMRQQSPGEEEMNEYGSLIEREPENTASLKSCLLSVSFILNCIHLGSLQLRTQFFYGTTKPWLVQVDHDNPNETSTYLNAFGIIQLCGLLVSSLGGILTDFCIKKFSVTSSVTLATRRAVAIYIGLSSVFAILFSIIVLVPVLPLQYLAFFLQVTFRSFLYGANATFLITMFPEAYFGKLYGFTVFFAAIIALLQYPLFDAVTYIYGGDFTVINISLLIISIATIIHPIVLYVRPVTVTRSANHDEG